MPTSSTRRLFLFAVFTVLLVSCADRAPVAPTDDHAALAPSRQLQHSSTPVDRPIRGDRPTTFTFLDPSQAGSCAVF
jgi:hypothetical protein